LGGLVKAAQLQPGESVLILGTTGAVGSVTVRIAHKRGDRVLGTVRMSAEIASASQLPVDLWIHLQTTDLAKGARVATDSKGADVVFDPVGGPMFENCLAALAWRGRQVAISSSPDPRVGFNLVDFYNNESRLVGVDSLKSSFEEAAEILGSLAPGFESGEFPPPEVHVFPLADGPKIYRKMHDSLIKAKVALKP
jgi:NADPH2:quinone reductase